MQSNETVKVGDRFCFGGPEAIVWTVASVEAGMAVVLKFRRQTLLETPTNLLAHPEWRR